MSVAFFVTSVLILVGEFEATRKASCLALNFSKVPVDNVAVVGFYADCGGVPGVLST